MSVHQDWSHEIELPAVPSSASLARAFVSQHLFAHAMPHLVEDIELVVSELATNAMVHARTSFTVVLCATDETVRLEVFDGSDTEPYLVVARSLDTRGRGVRIVQALSRDWGVVARVAGGKSVWARFDSSGQSERAAVTRLAPVNVSAEPGT